MQRVGKNIYKKVKICTSIEKYLHDSRMSQGLSPDSVWDRAIYTLWGGLQSDFLGNWFLHQVLLGK